MEYSKKLENVLVKLNKISQLDIYVSIEDNLLLIDIYIDYPNKDLSGVGITWQFCRYLDTLLNSSNADKYLDLVALGLDADMMSLKSFETKHLMQKGFKQLQNPFFEAMTEKNAYSMKNKINPISVAFYVAPYINAIVRSPQKLQPPPQTML
jgi:single-stranded DNA-specific DHH superfamily exonuclease